MAGIATLREQLAKVLAENIPDIKGKSSGSGALVIPRLYISRV